MCKIYFTSLKNYIHNNGNITFHYSWEICFDWKSNTVMHLLKNTYWTCQMYLEPWIWKLQNNIVSLVKGLNILFFYIIYCLSIHWWCLIRDIFSLFLDVLCVAFSPFYGKVQKMQYTPVLIVRQKLDGSFGNRGAMSEFMLQVIFAAEDVAVNLWWHIILFYRLYVLELLYDI